MTAIAMAAAEPRRETVLERVLREFEATVSQLPEHVLPQTARRHAAAELARLGWPRARDEHWRYTNLRALERIGSFAPVRPRVASAAPEAAVLATLPPVVAGFERLIFVDGVSTARSASVTARTAAVPRSHLEASAVWTAEQRLGLLGDMFALDAAVLRVADQAAIEVVFLSTESAVNAAVYPRLRIELAPGARLTLIERHLGQTSAPALVSTTICADLSRGAQLTHYRLQQCGSQIVFNDSLQATLQEQASYAVRQIGIGALAARTSARVRLAGRAASLSWQALAVGQGEQTHDTELRVEHIAPATRTEETFRGIADGRARVAFSGHIHIETGAPGAQTRQSLRGLIESAGAEIDLRPRLQIDVDEVSAQHGATTGQLDQNLLFYLLSRGLDPQQARALLKWAFLGDVLRSIELPALRTQAEQAAAGQLSDSAAIGALSRRPRGHPMMADAARKADANESPVAPPSERLPLSAAEVERLRADFPILSRQINGHPLVYLDSAASAQSPTAVLAAMERYVTSMHANVHRGVHSLSQWATEAYEQSRERVRRFLNARSTREIMFVRGTTEAINLVANSFGRSQLKPGDEVLITHLEHHANIVPWQMVCAATGATLRAAPVLADGSLDMAAFRDLLNERTRLVAVAHVSNALGTVLPVREITQLAHARGVPVLLDGAQAVAHAAVDMQALDCDFYAFSGHKIYGPTGIGVLYGRESLLQQMPPWQGGGDMILTVSIERTTYNELPWKFEAGTPNIVGAIGLAAALDYVEQIGRERIAAHEQRLLAQATAQVGALPGVRLIGTAADKAAVLSFTMDGVHPHDIGTILDSEGIAIRTGHHCAMPIMEYYGLAATARASFALYNRVEDIERLVAALHRVRELFA